VNYLADLEALEYHCFEVRQRLRASGLRLGLDLCPLNIAKLRTQVNVLIARSDMLARLTAGPRPVKWCTRLSASSSLDVYAAAAIAITSSDSSVGGSVSALAIDSTLM
jgi:hypothetical protein